MASLEGLFVGCNRELGISDYSPAFKLLAYGSKNVVSIWEPTHPERKYKGVIHTLKGHSGNVIDVKWVPGSDLLISSSEDKSIRVWKYSKSNDDNSPVFKQIQCLSDNDASVSVLAVLNERLFISGDASGKVKIWALDQATGHFTEVSSFKIKAGFYPLSLNFHEIKTNEYVLFIGGTNTNLYVYTFIFDGLKQVEALQQAAILPGHEDWIRSIAIKESKKEEQGSEYLIASGSQDRYIRVWRLCLGQFIDNSDQDKTKLRLLSNKQYKFEICGAADRQETEATKCSINFDAIIMGHDDWISDLKWHPTETKLLSSSADTSIMIWEPDMISGIWIGKVRLGELSIKGASTATGASGGFWSALWIFDEEIGSEWILTNGKTGSFRCWTSAIGEDNYIQQLSVNGPTGDITDLAWAENGDYLLATSLDQTTRLYSKWTKNNQNSIKTWHEFARPQIHGYDMICVAPISNTRFVSGGDEKIMRSFDEPKAVAQMLEKFCGITENVDAMPESASLPVLGLSNKAELDNVEQTSGEAQTGQNDDDDDENDEAVAGDISSSALAALTTPPLEDHLQRHTLWPEIEKMYGHGFEITTVDVSPDRKLIASACRSNVSKHAVIRIFNTDNWQQHKDPLAGHDLTITRVKFSPNNKYLVGVSRDRKFTFWSREAGDKEDTFKLIKVQEKAHSRIVWDICWFPLDLDSEKFITGSRDKVMKLWSKGSDDEIETISSIKLEDAITAVSSLPYSIDGSCIIAVGFENGEVHLYKISPADNYEFKFVTNLGLDLNPSDRISRLSFSDKKEEILLGIGSVDTSVRIVSIDQRSL